MKSNRFCFSLLFISVSLLSHFPIATQAQGDEIPVAITADLHDDKVHVNWTTESEDGVDLYIIERSFNRLGWEIVGTSEPMFKEGGRYHFLDQKPMEGKNFYRIRQSNQSGGIAFSRTTAVNNNYDNPAEIGVYSSYANGKITVSNVVDPGFVEIYDRDGKKVHTHPIRNYGVAELDLTHLPKGVYLTRIMSDRNFVACQITIN